MSQPHHQAETDWRKAIPESDRKAYKKSGFGSLLAHGSRSALIVIDVTLAFTGSKPQSLEEAMQEFPTACGEAAWNAIPKIRQLVDFFRKEKRPVVFTRSDIRAQQFAGTATKSNRPINPDPRFSEFPSLLAPNENEWILEKTKASVFFATPLNAYLQRQRIDTLVVCGVSTSGCVRASVIDAFSYGYKTFVADDCCFDRSYYAHCANLFDMDAKYATVVSLEEIFNILMQTKTLETSV